MAVTAIWNITGKIGAALSYVNNPEKMIDPGQFGNDCLVQGEMESIAQAIDYASNDDKTSGSVSGGHFVTGINCDPQVAVFEMMEVKKQHSKNSGNSAYHAYQSFSPGEATPEAAHEIGVKLAREVWGNRFQVVVATHLDKGHLHNHFILNSVSFVDGRKYNDCKATYRAIRNASDRLCKEYGLSVIDNPLPGKAQHYTEWSAERNGKPTWRSVIKADIDEAIKASMTDTQFYMALKSKGYEIKTGKDISVKPPGKERFFRLARNFGEDYTQEAIKRRILSQKRPTRISQNTEYIRRRPRNTLSRRPVRKVGGLMGLYLYYQYLLGIIPKKRRRPRRESFTLKADVAKMDRISQETRLLCGNRIETDAQLSSYRAGKQEGINLLMGKRDELRRRLRRAPDTAAAEAIKSEIAGITNTLRGLRREIKLADDIAERSGIIRENIATVNEKQTIEVQRKEIGKDELFRGSR